MKFFDKKYWERKFVDFWSIVHFSTGVVFAFVPFSLGLPFIQGFSMLFVFAVVWEYAEILKIPKEIRETNLNKLTDVVVALLGLVLVYLYMPSFNDTPMLFLSISIPISLFTAILAYVAWNAFDRYSGS